MSFLWKQLHETYVCFQSVISRSREGQGRFGTQHILSLCEWVSRAVTLELDCRELLESWAWRECCVGLGFGRLQGRPRYMCTCAVSELRAGLGPLQRGATVLQKLNFRK